MDATQISVGDRAVLGKVGYSGAAYAPVQGTYLGIDGASLNYATVEDTGIDLTPDADIANLHPLMAGALYEIGFAWEAGALSTWSN